MHEMSIAQSIAEIAIEHAQKEQAKSITELELQIGTLAGIEFESLQFALDSLRSNLWFRNTNFTINKVQAKAHCLDCSFEFNIVNLFSECPKCNSYATNIVCGKELKVKSLVID